jgi:hypothetical protein
MIEDECERVLGFISKAECTEIIKKHHGKDPYALYNELKSITATTKKEEPKETCKCECDGDCCKTESKPIKIEEIVVARLEKLAYELGKNGNHEAAYEIERTANQFK